MPNWEWVGKKSASKNLSIIQELPAGNAYGGQYLYDQAAPVITRTVRARGADEADYDAIEAKILTPAATHTFSLLGGGSFTGIPINIEGSQIEQTPYWEITCTVQVVS
jgi:hypothetical protein